MCGDSLKQNTKCQPGDGGSLPTSPLQSCYKCGCTGVRLYSTFGKLQCKQCIQSSPKRGTGHSGMIYRKDTNEKDFYISSREFLSLIPVPKSHPLFTKWFIEHYPGSKGIVGRQLNYLIYHFENPVGIIGVSSPPLNFAPFVKIFGDKYQNEVLNNNVFRIVIKVEDKNFGTKVLKLLRYTVKPNYQMKYGFSLSGLVTFVEPPRTGAIYKADNWIWIGQTMGIHVTRRGDWLNKTYEAGQRKEMFIRWIR